VDGIGGEMSIRTRGEENSQKGPANRVVKRPSAAPEDGRGDEEALPEFKKKKQLSIARCRLVEKRNRTVRLKKGRERSRFWGEGQFGVEGNKPWKRVWYSTRGGKRKLVQKGIAPVEGKSGCTRRLQ